MHYRKRKPSKAICAGCGALLHGVPRERPFIMQRLAKTKKRPERKFGGTLCSKCSRDKIKEHARSMYGICFFIDTKDAFPATGR